MIHTVKCLALALLALVIALPAFSREVPNQYQIELLIFSRVNPTSLNAEYWDPTLPETITHITQLITLEPESALPIQSYPVMTLMPTSSWALGKQAQAISTQWKTPILYHQAWRVERDQLLATKPSFRIENEEPTDANPVPKNAARLTGWMRIHLRRYFDVQLDLSAAEPSKQVSHYLQSKHTRCINQQWCYFTIKAKRRTRSGVINYIDHPLYGILLLITPVANIKPPELRGITEE